jgi:hypothetical protein
MLTGSWASGYYGEPRSTHDVDIVIEVSVDAVDALKAAFSQADYAFDEVAAAKAILTRSMFQLWHHQSGAGVDFWVASDDRFATVALERRKEIFIGGTRTYACSPEDLMIQKLKWSQMSGGSSKQINDVQGVYDMLRDSLEIAYIKRWIEHFQLQAEWNSVAEGTDRL